MGLIVERLRSIREKRGFSQRELARLCGLGEVMVHRYESGTTDPSTRYLTIIAEKLGISTDYLVGLSDNPEINGVNRELDNDERMMLDVYRGEGWPGVIRFGVERMTK